MDYAESLKKSLSPLPPAFYEAGLKLVTAEFDGQSAARDFFTMVFRNESSGVSLSISISMKHGSLTTFVKGSGQGFELSEYLKHKGRKEEFVARFFSKEPQVYIENLCHLIKTEWNGFIQGQRIENVPRDWMGYK